MSVQVSGTIAMVAAAAVIAGLCGWRLGRPAEPPAVAEAASPAPSEPAPTVPAVVVELMVETARLRVGVLAMRARDRPRHDRFTFRSGPALPPAASPAPSPAAIEVRVPSRPAPPAPYELIGITEEHTNVGPARTAFLTGPGLDTTRMVRPADMLGPHRVSWIGRDSLMLLHPPTRLATTLRLSD